MTMWLVVRVFVVLSDVHSWRVAMQLVMDEPQVDECLNVHVHDGVH